MQTQKSNVKFPWFALGVAVAIATAWGYTHRGKEDLVVTVPRQEPAANAPTVVRPPAARDATVVRAPAEKPPKVSQNEGEETLYIHPLNEPDPEKDADSALVEERNEKENRLHAIQHGD